MRKDGAARSRRKCCGIKMAASVIAIGRWKIGFPAQSIGGSQPRPHFPRVLNVEAEVVAVHQEIERAGLGQRVQFPRHEIRKA